MSLHLDQMLAEETARQRGGFARAALCAVVVGATAVLLLGLSGWFITASAAAGAAGAAVAVGFNYMLPSAGIRLLAILRTGGRYAERLASHRAALGTLARLRPRLFLALAEGPPAVALSLSAGEASARLVQDVDALEFSLVRRSVPWAVVAALGSGVVLVWLASPVAAMALLGFFGLCWAVARQLARRLQQPGAEVQRAAGRLKQEFAALVASAPELRAYGLEEWAAQRIATEGEKLAKAQAELSLRGGAFDVLLGLAVGVAAVATLLLAGWGLHAQAGSGTGNAGMALPPGLAFAAMAVLAAVMSMDAAVAALRGMERHGALQEARRRLDGMLCGHAVMHPSATMPPGPAVVGLPCHGVSISPGCVLGITGPSGVGKTSVLEQLMRLRPSPYGAVMLRRVDIGELAVEQVRACFSYAAQEAPLLAGTVRDTLALAAPDVSDEALWSALHDAALDERVRSLPQGLESWLGENGSRLSGGERRRLVLARALLRKAPWLLLDEPTEGLDAATEALVIQRLGARLARTGQGAILVSHRPAPLALCDRVLRLGLPQSAGGPSVLGTSVVGGGGVSGAGEFAPADWLPANGAAARPCLSVV